MEQGKHPLSFPEQALPGLNLFPPGWYIVLRNGYNANSNPCPIPGFLDNRNGPAFFDDTTR
jgi:hypothetical protein